VLCGKTGCGEGSELLVLADRGVETGDACAECGVLGLEPGDLVLARVGDGSVGGESADSLLECGLQVWVAAVERRPGDPGLAGEGGDVEFPAGWDVAAQKRVGGVADPLLDAAALFLAYPNEVWSSCPVGWRRAAWSCIAAAASIAVNTR
jgi:hypothetical protein